MCIPNSHDSCSRRTTVVAVRDAFRSKNLHGQIFLTGDEFKYAPEKRLNGQSEVFLQGISEAVSPVLAIIGKPSVRPSVRHTLVCNGQVGM